MILLANSSRGSGNHGFVFPAGEAWRAAWRRDPAAELYSPDGFHPTAKGSWLAALVMFEALYGRPPAAASLPAELSREDARMLIEAAAEANRRFGPDSERIRTGGGQ